MKYNNTAGLFIVCYKHNAHYCNNYFHFEKRLNNFELFFDAGCTKPFFLFKVIWKDKKNGLVSKLGKGLIREKNIKQDN